MGTRGFKAWRFRKRYYYQYNQYDSYPEGLGKEIASTIPSNSQDYLAWLEGQRQMVAEWEAKWDASLTVDPSNKGCLNLPDDLPDFMQEHPPTWRVPLNDLYMEWVYILDLDREIFSVNNGAHFRLEQVPHVDWIAALADGELGDKIVLPGVVSDDAIANLVAKPDLSVIDLHIGLENLTIVESSPPTLQKVTPKNVEHIPWRRRHGPILRSILFYLWSERMKDQLAAGLLQWTTEDLPFRETAFATLCLVLGGEHMTVIPETYLRANSLFGLRLGPTDGPELLSFLANGAHVRTNTPGSSPEGDIYWLEGVLVCLATQLYRPGAVETGILRVAQYCHKNHPGECVDAILLSIEHVILIHIFSDKKVQHTALLPLFDISNHLTMDVRDRYASSYLEKLASKDEKFLKKQQKRLRKAADESLRRDGMFIHRGNSDEEEEESSSEEDPALYSTQQEAEGSESSTFYALVYLFDAAARRRLAPSELRGGRLPNELYAHILSYVTDPRTRQSCMGVSRLFRQFCQEDVLLTPDLMLGSSEASEECVDPDGLPKSFSLYNAQSGTRSEVMVKQAGGFADFSRDLTLMVSVGTGYHKESLLSGLKFRFSGATT